MKSSSLSVAVVVCLGLVWSCSRSPTEGRGDGRRLRRHGGAPSHVAADLAVHVNESKAEVGAVGSGTPLAVGVALPNVTQFVHEHILQRLDDLATHHCFAQDNAREVDEDSAAPSACGLPLPNLIKAVTHLSFEMVYPSPWLPKLDKLTSEQLAQRRDYFMTASMLVVGLFMAVGVGLTVLSKKVAVGTRRDMALTENFRVVAQTSDEEIASQTKDIENVGWWRRRLLELNVRVHFVAVSFMMIFCLARQSFSSDYGAAWEFWLVWMIVSLSQGLVELVVVLCRGEDRDASLYPTKMIIGHVPWLSEKADTVKDVMFSALAWHVGDTQIALISFALLFLCHELFLHSGEVEGDLYDAYLPILTAAPPEKDTDTAIESASEETKPTVEQEAQTSKPMSRTRSSIVGQGLPRSKSRSSVVGAATKAAPEEGTKDVPRNEPGILANAQTVETLLKQTSAGRLRIAVMEDVPQAMLALLFVVRNGYCKYISGTFSLAVIRVLPSLPAVSRTVTLRITDSIYAELVKATRAGNTGKLHALLKRLKAANEPCNAKEFTLLGKIAFVLWACISSWLLLWFAYTVWVLLSHHVSRRVATVIVAEPIIMLLGVLIGWATGLWPITGCITLFMGFFALVLSTGNSSWMPLKVYLVLCVAPLLLVDCMLAGCSSMLGVQTKTLFEPRRVKPPETLFLMVRLLLDEVKCTLPDLKTLGFGPIELHKNGFKATELTEHFSVEEVLKAKAGFLIKDANLGHNQIGAKLPEDSAMVAALKETGYNAEDVRAILQTAPWVIDDVAGKKLNRQLARLQFTAQELKKINCEAEYLREAGYDAADVDEAGYTLKEMKAAGYPLKSLIQIGKTPKELKDVDFTAKALGQAGAPAKEVHAAGFEVHQMWEAFPLATLLRLDITLQHLLDADLLPEEIQQRVLQERRSFKSMGVTATEVLKAGYKLEEFKNKAFGFTAGDLKLAGLSAGELISVGGFTVQELRQGGFAAKDLRAADGKSAKDIFSADYTVQEMKEGGFSPKDLMQAGAKAKAVHTAGFTLLEMKDAFPASCLRAVDFITKRGEALKSKGGKAEKGKTGGATIDGILDAGYNSQDIKDVGLQAKDVIDGHGVAKEPRKTRRLIQAGFTLKELTGCGFTASDLKEAGISGKELHKANCCTIKQMREANFLARDLRDTDVKAAEMLSAGYTIKELAEGGFSAKDLHAAGVEARIIFELGYEADALRAAGISAKDIVDDYTTGQLAQKMKSAGFTNQELSNADPYRW
eukprot:TRINITY_DN5111_c0_g1_i3.p1 TRINITY_DN5111_c0_g1~~TRINITY_DN5111_c0_g1_i3.p1  ORF type:complete len:1261 (-),score=206.15 TRINITY_DN5111_c0_g1_i3:339-4121(-)